MLPDRDTVPTVSVLMPVFNAERHLCEAVESVLNQTFPDFEFVIVDDGSTDASPKLLNGFQDPRLRTRFREHRGLSCTRNELLAAARGEFVALMDADDVSCPDRLHRQVAFLRTHPRVGMVGTWMECIDDKGCPIFGAPITTPGNDVAIRLEMLQRCPFVNGSVLFRRAAAAGLEYRSLSPAEDYDFWLRLSEVCRTANLPVVLYRYRVHGKSASQVFGQGPLQDLTEHIQQLALQRLTLGLDDRGGRIATDSRLSSMPAADHDALTDEVYATVCAWVWSAARLGRYRLSVALLGRAMLLAVRRPGASARAVWGVASEIYRQSRPGDTLRRLARKVGATILKTSVAALRNTQCGRVGPDRARCEDTTGDIGCRYE